MDNKYIINRMDEAIKEDRNRFFLVADTLHLQPKYKHNIQELEELKQWWRDIPSFDNYPCMAWPPSLPNWFPEIRFASCWDESHIEKCLNQFEKSNQ